VGDVVGSDEVALPTRSATGVTEEGAATATRTTTATRAINSRTDMRDTPESSLGEVDETVARAGDS
jgi:hypothetical protein